MRICSDKQINHESKRTKKSIKSHRELYLALKGWHQSGLNNLNVIVEHKDADLNFGSGLEIKAGTEKAKGFHAGVMIALHYLSPFPVLQASTDEEGDDGNQ